MSLPKETAGKRQVHLVPSILVTEVAKVREFGVEKYKGPDGWKMMTALDYIDAAYRHTLKVIDAIDKGDPTLLFDEESGETHFAHAATCWAFVMSKFADGEEIVKDKSDLLLSKKEPKIC